MGVEEGKSWEEMGKGRENEDICNGLSNKNKVKKKRNSLSIILARKGTQLEN